MSSLLKNNTIKGRRFHSQANIHHTSEHSIHTPAIILQQFHRCAFLQKDAIAQDFVQISYLHMSDLIPSNQDPLLAQYQDEGARIRLGRVPEQSGPKEAQLIAGSAVIGVKSETGMMRRERRVLAPKPPCC